MSKVKIFLTKKADLQLLIIHFVHIVWAFFFFCIKILNNTVLKFDHLIFSTPLNFVP